MNHSERAEHLLAVFVAAVVCFGCGFFLDLFPKYALAITAAYTLYGLWRWKQRTDKIVRLTPVVAFVLGQIAMQAFGHWYRKQP